MARRFLVAFTCLCCAGCLPSLRGRGADEAAKKLERNWQAIEQKRPTLGSRELFGFALEAAANRWHPERVAQAFALAEEMQDRDEASKTCGNFRWYWRAEKPEDLNAVEFCMQQGVLLWMRYRSRLDAEGRERLERLIRYSIEGLRRHRVAESYTNIFLMKTWNCIAIGEATGRPDLAEEGYQMLDRWLLHTWRNGVTEYVSPTYYGVDLDSLGLIARFAGRRSARRAAEAALRLLWTDIAANWFAPCQRLGGAHSRDYDYLTGHGYLDLHLRAAGWLPDPKPPAASAFLELCQWTPPRRLGTGMEGRAPRIVHQRWGKEPWETATHYVGQRFSIGSAGATYGPEDKPFAINLGGGPKMPMALFFMDARGDPYGKKRIPTGGGHLKSHHVTPFLTSVQRGPEVLLLASADPASRSFKRYAPEPACLLSHVVLPANVKVWLGNEQVKLSDAPSETRVPDGEAVFIGFQGVAVGIRFVVAADASGKPAPVALATDGREYGTMRLTCTHAAAAPAGRGVVALWVRAAEGLDETAFAEFRKSFAGAKVEAKAEGNTVEVSVPGVESRLRLVADVATWQRLAREGAEPGAEERLLAVNGHDLGREILSRVVPRGSSASGPAPNAKRR